MEKIGILDSTLLESRDPNVLKIGALFVSFFCYEEIAMPQLLNDEQLLSRFIKSDRCPNILRSFAGHIRNVEIVDLNNDNTNDFVLHMVLVTAEITPRKHVMFAGFRGTRPFMLIDWIQNLHILPNAKANLKGSRHAGFAYLGDRVNDGFFTKVLQDKTVDKVIFCGHSLGGAISKIVAVNVLLALNKADRNSSKIQCLSFGDPLCYDEPFAEDFKLQLTNIQDIGNIFQSTVIAGDVVPVVLSSLSVEKEFINIVVKILKVLSGIENDAGQSL